MKSKVILLLIVLALFAGRRGQAEDTRTSNPAPVCRVGQQAPAIGFWTWSANSRVKVYIRLVDFKADQLPALFSAMDSWNLVSEQTASGVKFEYQGDTATELTCTGCMTIIRGTVFDKAKRHLTELKAYSAHHDQLISYATIIVDQSLTNPEAILNALVHELGHNLGLLDCYSCKEKSTVMNQLKGVNRSNGMEGPTGCDIAQVRRAYEELKVRVRPSPPNRNQIDEGEEPVDDDTPVIIPKPPRL